ncbi:hypothetical protein Paz_18 [Xylella phage Paz]|uniref:Uncharacterized protein n=1 Tax=Xylella phage Paz TaxID=1415145 RepID=V5Q9K8_9CAUD|nr:hypothetical protein Paz_18 [Xylella phage Paz]AHB12115.1 hypothetical protein Paz_18 [Xylella phage Paz]
MALNAAMKARLAKAKQVGPNMNEAQQGGGGYTPPAEGVTRLRLVGYFEVGEHTEQSGKFIGKKNKKVQLVWELSGKNHEPAEHEGKKIPIRMTQELNYSLNEKATFYKLFVELNACHGNEATIFAELLGKEFIGNVVHSTKGEGTAKRTYANLTKIRKAVRLDEDDNEVPVKVDDPITEPKFFVWDIATMEDWDAIFIDGEYPERKDKDGNVIQKARSKNVLQDKIRSANNFDTLPIAEFIRAGVSAKDEADMDEALGDDDNTDADAGEDEVHTPADGHADVDDLV